MSNNCHSHPKNNNQIKLIIGAILAFSYFSIEVVGGIWVGSIALLADGAHMFADFIALIIAIFGFKLATKAANSKMTYGYPRAQIVSAFLNGASLVVISLGIIGFAIHRIIYPEEVMGKEMFIIGLIGLGINLTIFLILHSGDQENMNMRGATLHFMGDTLSSVAVVSAAAIIYYTGWNLADPILSIFVASIIFYNAWRLTKSATNLLLQGTPEGYDTDEIKQKLLDKFNFLETINEIHLWALNEQELVITIKSQTRLDKVEQQHLQELHSFIQELNINKATLELLPKNSS